jgi:hypothetical protein
VTTNSSLHNSVDRLVKSGFFAVAGGCSMWHGAASSVGAALEQE